MIDDLQLKIERIYASLNALSSSDLAKIKTEIVDGPDFLYRSVDFSTSSTPAELANAAQSLVANIACIKDHLAAWSKRSGIKFTGDELINSNKSVAIIHDIWNVDKHYELKFKPRSGFTPRLINLRTVMRMSTGSGEGESGVVMTFGEDGQVVMQTMGGGSAALVLTAEVVDDLDQVQGDFEQLCTTAVEAWLAELKTAGVPIA